MTNTWIDGYAAAAKREAKASALTYDESEALWARASDEAAKTFADGSVDHEKLTHSVRARMLDELIGEAND